MNRNELKESLKGILAEDRGKAPAYHSPICNECRHHRKGTLWCEKHKEWIPEEVLDGEADCKEYLKK